MLYNLHVLRVIAALSVVYFHITSVAGLNLEANVGSRGVDVFFVISGFIIAFIGSKKPEQFLVRRLIRVVPFYWAATLLVFAIVLVFPTLMRTTHADWVHLGYSLLFIPHMSYGTDEPTLVLGWSLNFEMFFYVWFAIALRISPARSPLVCAAFILAFVLAIHAIGTDNEILSYYARPIVLEFIFGIIAFYAYDWVAARRAKLAAIPALKWVIALLVLAAFGVLVAGEYFYDQWGLPRHIIAGIPSFVIVLGALTLETAYGVRTTNKTIVLVGESSYIIYLVHPYIIYTVLRVIVRGRELSSVVEVPLIIALLGMTAAVACCIHLWFEKPVMAFLRRKLGA